MEQEQPANNSAMQEEIPMRLLKIKTLTDTTYELRVPENMLIKDLRLKVQEISGVPAERQRMICMGQQLIDTKTVGDYAKDPEQPNWIHLVAKVQSQNQGEQNQNQQSQQQPQQQQPQQQNRRPGLDMFGGNVQIQTGVGDLSQLLGNITNLFSIPNNSSRLLQQPQQGQNQLQQQQQQQQQQQTQQQVHNPIIQTAQFTVPLSTNIPLAQTQPTQQNSQPSNVRSNLVSNQQPITIQRQIQLPHQELLNLGLICNNLMGPQSSFPGPPLPQIPNRTPASLIGSYLSNWQFQVQRTLPFVHRLAELLQREHYMNIQEDRSSTQALSLEVGRALNELVACTQPLVGILSDIQFNQHPGQVRFEQNQGNSAPVLTRPPPLLPSQLTSFLSSNNVGNNNGTTQNNQNTSNSTSSTTQQGSNISQTLNQPNIQATIQVSATPITSFFSSQPIRTQASTQPAQAQNQQGQQPPQTNINISQNPTNNNNSSLNDLINQISGGQNGEVRIGVMNTQDNDQEIQIVGIGQTHVVDSDSNMNLQQVLGNILGQVGNQNGSININSISSARTSAQQPNSSNQPNNSNSQQNQHVDEEWEDEEEEQTIGIDISNTINLGGDNPLLQNLLSSLGINGGNTSVSISGNNLPQVSTTTISGAQAANLLSQLNRQTQQLNSQQQQQQQQPSTSNQTQNQQPQQAFQPQQNIQIPQQNGVQQQQQPAQQTGLQGLSMMMQGGNGGFNPLSMLMGGGLGGMMNMTVDELIRENMTAQDEENQSEADELVQSIIGQLRISDLVSSFISGQFGFLNTIQQKIRDQITSRGLGREQFSEQFASALSQYLIVPEQHQGLIFEGIEPHNIALDILETRLPVIYDIIFRDFPEDGTDRFSGEFVYEIKKIAGEVFSEISECLHGGINDLERIFRTWVNEPIVRIMGEGTQGLIDSFITSMLWEKVKALVLQHKHEQQIDQRPSEEQKQNNDGSSGQMEIERPVQNRGELELDLLEDIENQLERDETRFERYNIQLSDEYKKGDFKQNTK